VTLIVAGTVRVPAENLGGLRPHMAAMMAASQAEDGCFDYNYAEDVTEPGLIHVFERWCDQAALDAHFKTAHMVNWRAVWASFGVSDRRLFAYEVASERPL
jgi:quinol monooxygenase YgiN